MSSVPDLVPALRQWTRTEKDTRQFSMRALQTLVTTLSPLASAAQTLRVTYDGLLLRGSTLPDAPRGTLIKPDALSVYTRVLAERQPAVDQEHRLIIQPLFFADTLELLLEIHVAPDYPLDKQADEALRTTTSAAEQFALLLENQQALHLIQTLAQTSSDLTTCHTYQDIATVLGVNLLEDHQFVSINLFDHDAKGGLTGFRVVASASSTRSYQIDTQHFVFTADDEQELYQRMLNGDDSYIGDVATDPRLTTALRGQLMDWHIKSVYLLPLQFGGRLNGFISINDTQSAVLLMPVEKQTFFSVAAQTSSAIENQQYIQEVKQSDALSREQIHVLGRLNDLAISSSGAADEATLLRKAAPVLTEISAADRCGIALHDDNNEQTATVVSVYPPNEAMTGVKLDLAQHTIMRTLLKTGVPLAVGDVATSDDISDDTREALLAVGTKAVLFIPLFDLDGHLMGSVGLDYFEPHEFDRERVDIVRTFTGQIGVSLQKLRLLDSSRRQVEQMQRMTGFSQAVQATLDMETILTTILQEAPGVVAFDYLSIMLYDRDAGYIRQCARLMDGRPQVELPGTLLTPGVDTLAHKSWTDQVTQRVDDMKTTWEWQHPYSNAFRTLVSTPITSGASRRGVLEIGSLRAGAYNDSDLAALGQMSNQIAIVLDNAEAFERSQRTARHKALANQISARLQEQMDIEGILSTTVNELGRAVGAKSARIRLGLQADTGQKKQE